MSQRLDRQIATNEGPCQIVIMTYLSRPGVVVEGGAPELVHRSTVAPLHRQVPRLQHHPAVHHV